MYILGISAYYHDSAAALIKDGTVIAAAQEERFTREKNDSSFPRHACLYCLDFANITIFDISYIVFYDKPFLKFERLIESYYRHAPKGLKSFLTSMPVWLKDKFHLKRVIKKELKKLFAFDSKPTFELLFSEHHLSHAASAYYVSPFSSATILTIDGVGEWATTSIFKGEGGNITLLKELHYPDSLGLLYSSFTYFLGFKVNSGEYKMMGLAPYGDKDAKETQRYISLIVDNIVKIYPDGGIHLNEAYFSYSYDLKMIREKKWEKLFGISRRYPDTRICQHHCNLAYAIQYITEEIVLKLAGEAKRITQEANLCLAGGVALNCVANGRLLNENIFENIYIQPAAGDAGGAIGAALTAYYLLTQSKKLSSDGMHGAFLGPSYADDEVKSAIEKCNYEYKYYTNFDELTGHIADFLQQGKIVGYFQDRMEFGPRALGNRSILADPRFSDIHQFINQKVKLRETFRPFAPAVLEEDCSEYFNLKVKSPYMLFVSSLNEKHIKKPDSSYRKKGIQEKLSTVRSDLNSITHVDFSARVQTVNKEFNPKFYRLLL
ncbi:MAG: hypothetical protein LBI60_01800, partial [Bacteroidales bacterium]|nr:hypothetical protein [Bacteroidales bacterium]